MVKALPFDILIGEWVKKKTGVNGISFKRRKIYTFLQGQNKGSIGFVLPFAHLTHAVDIIFVGARYFAVGTDAVFIVIMATNIVTYHTFTVYILMLSTVLTASFATPIPIFFVRTRNAAGRTGTGFKTCAVFARHLTFGASSIYIPILVEALEIASATHAIVISMHASITAIGTNTVLIEMGAGGGT